MKISIFGIGYVGAVSAACLAESGHEIIALDVDERKLEFLRKGQAPVMEHGLEELVSKHVAAGHLRASSDIGEAIEGSDMSFICVGTPSRKDGALNLDYIKDVARQIGGALKDKESFNIIVNRSTVLPGTLMNVICPLVEEASGKKHGEGFALANNPEFLREGTAISDYFSPTEIVVGAVDKEIGACVMSLYEGLEAPRIICTPDVGEGVKYVSNAWRANKVSFANEMGNILSAHGVDSHKVMDIFFKDIKSNLSKTFLSPGFAFGGSCLPKDVRAFRAAGHAKGLETPLCNSLLKANEAQIERSFEMICKIGKRNVSMLGLSFKAGTDDLRESPLITLAEKLLDAGLTLKIYDPCVYRSLERQENLNTSDVLCCLVKEPQELMAEAEIFVTGHKTEEFIQILNAVDQDIPLIDLVRLGGDFEKRIHYKGLCW